MNIPFTKVPTEPVAIKNKKFNKAEIQFLDKEIQELCSQKCIVKCEVRPFVVSPINLVPKKDGSFRLVTDRLTRGIELWRNANMMIFIISWKRN